VPAVRATGPRGGFGFVARAVAVGFWGTLITLIVSAAVAPGFAILALLPLLGMPYLLFCFVALTGDRNVE
jgi:urea transporter